MGGAVENGSHAPTPKINGKRSSENEKVSVKDKVPS
jgi:hypothetical protein